MQAIDNALLGWLVQPAQTSAAILAGLRAVTELGSWWVTLSATALSALLLYLLGERRRSGALLLVVLTGRLSVELLKTWMDRPRPALVDYHVVTHSLSFPSGHAANSTITYLSLALVAGPLARGGRSARLAAAMLALTIGLTRPMLGVHWPSDVVAGWSWGLAWTLTGVWLLDRWVTGQPNTRLPRSA